MREDRYFLRATGCPWSEVTKANWIKAERAAGFRPTTVTYGDPNYANTCATGGFGGAGVEGRIVAMEYWEQHRKHYDALFCALVEGK